MPAGRVESENGTVKAFDFCVGVLRERPVGW
jgi:hypothetical protein